MEIRKDLKHRILVAMGKEPADILFVHGKVVSTFTEEVVETDVAVANGMVVALGYAKDASKVVDLKGAYLAPSFIDSHIHIESSMLSPEGFAEAVVPHGTGVVVSDPHEIVNVWGLDGLKYMLQASENLPMEILFTIPSCVPATHMETAGGTIGAEDIRKAFDLNKKTPALSEMMNYPGVFLGFDDVLDKICTAHDLGLSIDGHSPMLKGECLNAYLNALIDTDHECTNVEEAMEKLRRGMYVLIREGSAARNLKDLVAMVTDKTAHRICIATDDRHPDDLLEKGHLDYTLRLLIENGVNPLRAIRLMTLNPATLYRMERRGGIAPGYRADLVVFENLRKPEIRDVYHDGVQIVADRKLVLPIPRKQKDFRTSVILPKNLQDALRKFPKSGKVRVIGIMEGQILTENLTGQAEDINKQDMAYLAVVERHGKNGQVGLGFVKGLGIKQGALASTVAHDSHNLILVGKSIEDMEAAAQAIAKMGGGFAVVKNKTVQSSVSLPVGGLMSPAGANEISESIKKLDQAAKTLGIGIASPFMVLSFLALPVIPHLKLTDKGLVDVDRFELVSLEAKP